MSWSLLYLASEWVIRFVMLIYVPQKRPAAASRAWLLLIFLLPWPGLLVYAFFGRAFLPRRRLQRQRRLEQHLGEKREGLREILGTAGDLPHGVRPLAVLAEDLGGFRPLGGNSVELLPDYSGAIDRLVADIEASTSTVHLLFYIFENDGTGRRVAEALVGAAGRGVTCRVVMDALGSKRGLKVLGPKLKAAGIEVVTALPVGLFKRHTARYDLRNHRKIAVLDGRIGYAGSQNLVDGLFVKGYPNEELWARLEGPAVLQLQAVFLSDYFCETGAMFDGPECFPMVPPAGTSNCQVVPSGPSFRRENGQELIVAMLYTARERVCITTPYFIPDEPFLEALRTAARRGVEVRLVLSMHANQPLSQLAQRAYYDDLLEVGIHIHLYEPRFLHAKHLTADSEVALIGSTNMDIRSFALNEEINLLVYDPEVVARVREIQERYLAHGEELTLAGWRSRPAWAKVAHNTARLLDSLL
jgi:cardiolipin synthase A/B